MPMACIADLFRKWLFEHRNLLELQLEDPAVDTQEEFAVVLQADCRADDFRIIFETRSRNNGAWWQPVRREWQIWNMNGERTTAVIELNGERVFEHQAD